jgi:UDP-N-acetylglucosamine 2-epimerase (non-hydrolysing)
MLDRNFSKVSVGKHLRVANVFGTRPEVLKFMPVIEELRSRSDLFEAHNILSWQHSGLVEPILDFFKIPIDHELAIPSDRRSLDDLLSSLVAKLDSVLGSVAPHLVLVQGDTATAVAGAISGYHHKIPVVHIEAGLRSGDRYSPYPEEMYRRMISQIATYHMAATPLNRRTLEAEGVPSQRIFLTGNPIVDAVRRVRAKTRPSAELQTLLRQFEGHRMIVLTTHRRENFGSVMHAHLSALRDFVRRHEDVVLVFPVHPNPAVRAECKRAGLHGPRIVLVEPMLYPDFLHLLSAAWIVASDSGGVQEEVPTLGKPLLILRENTERREVVTSGFGRLVGSDPQTLEAELEDLARNDHWLRNVRSIANPFGRGDSASRIVDALAEIAADGVLKRASA